MRLNLGAGRDIQKGYVNIDALPLPGIDVVHDLGRYPWPIGDAEVESIRAVDVVEHLPSHTSDGRPGVVAFVEECHRALVIGGELFIQTPRYDAEFLWIDPTHVRGFHEQSFDFFDPKKPFGMSTGFYSRAKFCVRCEVLLNKNLRFWLTKC